MNHQDIGVYSGNMAKRDAVLAGNRLDPYARARILGTRAWHAQPKAAVLSDERRPSPPKPLARLHGLPMIAEAAARAWGTTLEKMRANRRAGNDVCAVFAACRLAREFTSLSFIEISHFFGRRNGKSAYEWCIRDRELCKADAAYVERYAAAKASLSHGTTT